MSKEVMITNSRLSLREAKKLRKQLNQRIATQTNEATITKDALKLAMRRMGIDLPISFDILVEGEEVGQFEVESFKIRWTGGFIKV